MTVVAAVLILGGALFLGVSIVGLIRLPDFYTRAHAAGKSETLGAMLLLGGLVVYHGFDLVSAKLIMVLALVALTNPTAVHAMTRAALRSGLEIWTRRDGPAREPGTGPATEDDGMSEAARTAE